MTLTNADWAEVASELLAPELAGASLPPPRFNVAPSQPHPVLARRASGEIGVLMATWGFNHSKQGPLVINARAETVFVSPLFREPFARHRCVVVTDGFLEWRKTGAGRQPIWFQSKRRGALYLAGLLQIPTRTGAAPQFVVLTTPPNADVAPTHNRMPAVLAPRDVSVWLERPDPSLLRSAPDGYLSAVEVSTRVNSAANDDPECLGPLLHNREQLSLF